MPPARTLVKILTLKCREATELMSRSLDDDLGLGDRLAMRLHTLICRPCRRFRTQIGRIRRCLRGGEPIADAGKTDLTP